MSKQHKKGGIIKGLIIGGAIGSVMSLLLSSKKGKECRDEIKTSSKSFWKRLFKK